MKISLSYLFFITSFSSMACFAIGPNDGVYEVSSSALPNLNQVVSIHQGTGPAGPTAVQTVAFMLINGDNARTFELGAGERIGNTVEFNLTMGTGSVKLELEFLTENTARFRILSCTSAIAPGFSCNFGAPVGTVFNLTRIL